jgi:hypothetical protein
VSRSTVSKTNIRHLLLLASPGGRFAPVNANSTQSLGTDSLMPPAPIDRRPAIWPWLVMPLVTLAVFYGLYDLDRMNSQQDQSAYHPTAQSASETPDDSESR